MDASGGTVAQAKDDTVWKNFTDVAGVDLKQELQADTAKFVALAEAGGDIPWDRAGIPTVADFEVLKEKGLLRPLDLSVVPEDQLEPGTVDPEGVAVQLYAANVTWNTDKWPLDGIHPQGLADVFNTEDFPGKRCMFSYPEFGATLESRCWPTVWHLTSSTRSTSTGPWPSWTPSRATSSGGTPVRRRWSCSPLVSATSASPGPGASSPTCRTRTLRWPSDGIPPSRPHAVFTIPKDAPNPDLGNALISFFVRDKQGQIDYVLRTWYTTALTSLSSPEDYPEEISPWLPLGENAPGVIPQDEQWYAENIGELTETFSAWLAQ